MSIFLKRWENKIELLCNFMIMQFSHNFLRFANRYNSTMCQWTQENCTKALMRAHGSFVYLVSDASIFLELPLPKNIFLLTDSNKNFSPFAFSNSNDSLQQQNANWTRKLKFFAACRHQFFVSPTGESAFVTWREERRDHCLAANNS